MSENVATLLEFLHASGRQAVARGLIDDLAAAGVETPMMLGDRAPTKAAAAPGAQSAPLVRLQIAALDEVLTGFDGVLDKAARRIRLGGLLRDGATLVTTLSSSAAVIAAINAVGKSTATLVFAAVAAVASVATFFAGRLNGGDANLAGRYADVAVKVAEAKALRRELQEHLSPEPDPEFVKSRLEAAAALVEALRRTRAEWSIV